MNAKINVWSPDYDLKIAVGVPEPYLLLDDDKNGDDDFKKSPQLLGRDATGLRFRRFSSSEKKPRAKMLGLQGGAQHFRKDTAKTIGRILMLKRCLEKSRNDHQENDNTQFWLLGMHKNPTAS